MGAWQRVVGVRSVAGAVGVLLSLALGACKDREASARALPAAEFLFAAGDSTYWARSSAEGMRVRSAPILLTEVDGRLFEIYLADEGAEYPDASFAAARLWTRELKTGDGADSTLLFGDGAVMDALARWKQQHPRAAEVDPAADEAPEDPRTVVTDEIEIVDVHGPWITLEHLLDIDVEAGPPHRHEGRRFVVDVRTGARTSLTALFGEAAAQQVMAAGQASLVQLVDSIRTASNSGDERAGVAAETLDSFRFDATSFGITDLSRAPAVAFMVPGRGVDGEALALYLPPIAVKAPAWWRTVRPTLPEWAADSGLVKWERRGYDVSARPSAEGDALSLVLVGRGMKGGREWPVATVATPAYQLIPLDEPPLDARMREAALRDALARAFDRSTAMDGMTQRAERPATRRELRRLRATGVPRVPIRRVAFVTVR